MADEATAYVDGSCLGNPGPGGWAVVFDHAGETREWSTAHPAATTNNQMELEAALSALREAHKLGLRGLVIVTDSQYVQRGAEEWSPRWEAAGWRTRAGRPVKYLELWKALREGVQLTDVRWRWTRGHVDSTSKHSQADRRARAAAHVALSWSDSSAIATSVRE